MGERSNSVQSAPIVSDAAVREVLRREIKRAYVQKVTSRERLSHDSGVSVDQIDQIMRTTAEHQRRVALADALSIAWALGERVVNAIIAEIGYGFARPADQDEALQPTVMAATALAKLSVIATAAADGRIDHTELPACREAADELIATIKPISSFGGKA